MKYWLLLLLCINIQLSFGQSKTDVITLNSQRLKSLSQESFSSGNGYYIIEGNFDLRGRTINLPNGCYLNFKGGSISNGHLYGELENEYVRPEWFGAKGNGSHDDTEAIQMAVDLGKHVLLSGRYCVSHSIIVKNQGITLEKGSEIKAIGNAIDYILKYQGTTNPVYLDGGGVLNANGICGGIYYDTPKTFRLQNIYINNVAYHPALTVKNGFIESYNVNCNGSKVSKAKQPKAVVSLEGGSDHKFDRWTIVTKTTGIAGCGGSSIFTRVHIWGGSDVGFSVNSSSCTFNMCYTDYCKIGFELLNPNKGKMGGIYILNHNTIGQRFRYSCLIAFSKSYRHSNTCLSFGLQDEVDSLFTRNNKWLMRSSDKRFNHSWQQRLHSHAPAFRVITQQRCFNGLSIFQYRCQAVGGMEWKRMGVFCFIS